MIISKVEMVKLPVKTKETLKKWHCQEGQSVYKYEVLKEITKCIRQYNHFLPHLC